MNFLLDNVIKKTIKYNVKKSVIQIFYLKKIKYLVINYNKKSIYILIKYKNNILDIKELLYGLKYII